MSSINLKYGCNPNQKNASVKYHDKLPFTVLNGKPGYINLLDALNGYQLVKELKEATSYDAATSFKHVSPAGAAISLPLTEVEKKMYYVKDEYLSPIATAYIRARGADRMSSFGDFIALSSICDLSCAKIISKEVSDGIIAPGYSDEALEILKRKRKGNYTILQINPTFEPPAVESRTVYGLTFTQDRNDYKVTDEDFKNILTLNKNLTENAKLDLTIGLISLKYTQSNSVCYIKNGQAIGIGAGGQSRIHCTRLAGEKADKWSLRQMPKVLNLPFKEKISRNDKDNIIEQYLLDNPEIDLFSSWDQYFSSPIEKLTREEKETYLKTIDNISLASDAFFPFRDNIDRAKKSGVRYIVQPGGSLRDDIIIKACDEHDMFMCFNKTRLFHH